MNLLIEPLVRNALLEDLGRAGDITTDGIVPASATSYAVVRARKDGRLCGVECALAAFRIVDPKIDVRARAEDGHDVTAGQDLLSVRGSTRAILTAERTALNFLCRLSGIATATQRFARAIAGTNATIIDTRKTTPGLRILEKYAVRVGGGMNHRFGLDDAVLIKDNHVAFAGGIKPAVEAVRRSVGHLVKIEVEVDDLEQLEECLALGVEIVLLDNFSLEKMREAVATTAGRAVLEASGRVTEENVRAIAETGVDLISSGWITHSAPALDIGVDFLD
jgi:nicotinate-nucleotide pyrophosphorylase (carboxylating)